MGQARPTWSQKKRLDDLNIALALVVLDQHSGRSDHHRHTGDEFLLVLEGQVEVSLKGMGLRERIVAGDYAHFYAEQSHWIRNVGGNAGLCPCR